MGMNGCILTEQNRRISTSEKRLFFLCNSFKKYGAWIKRAPVYKKVGLTLQTSVQGPQAVCTRWGAVHRLPAAFC